MPERRNKLNKQIIKCQAIVEVLWNIVCYGDLASALTLNSEHWTLNLLITLAAEELNIWIQVIIQSTDTIVQRHETWQWCRCSSVKLRPHWRFGVQVNFLSSARCTGDKKSTATFCRLRLRRRCGQTFTVADTLASIHASMTRLALAGFNNFTDVTHFTIHLLLTEHC